MRLLLAWLLALLPAVAAAQDPFTLLRADLPALYRVTGVAADDVLNIRAGPAASHPIIGAFAPDATGIEVFGQNADGRWVQVNTGERRGWAAARFLTREGPDWAAGLPQPMRCFGVEPFWSFDRDGGAIAEFSSPDGPPVSYLQRLAEAPQGRQPFAFGAHFEGDFSTISAWIRRENCSDGASDRGYGLSILMLRIDGGGNQVLDGCCTLAP